MPHAKHEHAHHPHQNLIKGIANTNPGTARLGPRGEGQGPRSCPPRPLSQRGYAGSSRGLYLGQHEAELLPGERQQEGADDPPQRALGHGPAVTGVQQLKGFPQLISLLGDFFK